MDQHQRQLDILLNEAHGDDWVYRRDHQIRRPLDRAISTKGLPYLAPELILLFKSKQPRAKDHQDFGLILPTLLPDARSWLFKAIQLTTPDHAWLDLLA